MRLRESMLAWFLLRIVLSECNGQRGAEGPELSVVYRS